MCACYLLSCVQLCEAMDCSPPGSSVHGILQAVIPESVAISFSRDQTQVSCIAGGFFTISATREAHCFLNNMLYVTLQLISLIFM